MEITNLQQRGKSELYKTYINDQYVCLLEAEIIVKQKLKIGSILTEEQFNLIRQQSEALTCKNMAINYVSKSLKTKKQVKDYLKQKGFLTQSINNAVNLLEDYGYINDRYYAETFVKAKQNQKGIMYLKNALKEKGVSQNIIEDIFVDFETSLDDIVLLAKKFVKNKILDAKLKEKLYRHLISKGFTYEQINKAIQIVLKGEHDDWN